MRVTVYTPRERPVTICRIRGVVQLASGARRASQALTLHLLAVTLSSCTNVDGLGLVPEPDIEVFTQIALEPGQTLTVNVISEKGTVEFSQSTNQGPPSPRSAFAETDLPLGRYTVTAAISSNPQLECDPSQLVLDEGVQADITVVAEADSSACSIEVAAGIPA